MGLYTIGLQQQEVSAGSGRSSYPQIGQIKKDSTIIDEFARGSLNPTDTPLFYTTISNDSNGTATISDARNLVLTTDSSAIGDDVNTRTSGVSFERVPINSVTDLRSQIITNVIFNIGQTADTEGFIGLINDFAGFAGVPTTTRHIGLFWDASAQANFILSSGNGSAQATTDTGIALATGVFRLQMIWPGNDSARVEFFTPGPPDTLDAIHTVTTLNMATRAFMLHFFVQTEAAAAKTVNITEWISETT